MKAKSPVRGNGLALASFGRDNNFDLIRLAAALQVALLHSTGHLEAAFPIADFLRKFPGVPIFFYLSGMMVTASACRRSLRDYAEARARRIFPALWLAFAITLVLLGAFGQLEFGPVFWIWSFCQLTVFQVFNPEMFRDFGVGAVNGSLWTIPVEVGFYIILPVLLFIAGGSKKTATALFVLGALLTFPVNYMLTPVPEDLIGKVIYTSPLAHFWLFALGGLTCLHWGAVKPLVDRIHWLIPLPVYIAFAYLLQPLLPGIVGSALGYLLLCASVLWLGMGAPTVVGILRGNDISYGLYLFHMLAVNAFLELQLMGWPGVIGALTISVGVALLSWRYLESIVLRRGRKSIPAAAS